jgi:hypothetical protein
MGELVYLPEQKDWLSDNKEVDIVTEKEPEEDHIRRSTESVLSDATTVRPLEDDPSFHPNHVFRLDARGIGLLRLPLPPRQLEIPIYGADGSLAYMSRRSKRCSGDCVLSHPQLGDLLSTTFYFGPKRDPVIRFLQYQGENENNNNHPSPADISVSGSWSSRTTSFTTPEGRAFRWSYAKRKDSNGRRVNLIILHRKQDHGSDKVLAQLVRSDETRTTGSSRSTAGNGGVLMVDQEACKSLDETLIISTCLIMLKKEIDRRRAVQMAVMAGIAAGGV